MCFPLLRACDKVLFFSKPFAPTRTKFIKKIKSDLVAVSVDMYKKNPIFLPGQKVCRKCQTRLSKEEDASCDGGEGGEGRGGGDVGAVEGGD